MEGYNIVLVYPEIPNNTGNIGRLCVGTNSRLHLVHPLGFKIDDSRVKRAGLDYWPQLDLVHHDDISAVMSAVEDPSQIIMMSSGGEQSVYKRSIKQGDWIFFGAESVGLPKDLMSQHAAQVYTIPFPGEIRSFNLGNAVSMVLGEAIRQATI
jgi:tRNA (cytidine/uridine-2'-O-)-methyltransferase